MSEGKITCSSCNKRISNTMGSTRFMCPRCAKQEIVRCFHCRQLAAKYTCKSCNFEGPN